MNKALYDKEYTCPVCSKKFTSKRVKSAFVKTEKRDADFCVHYKDINPMFYSAFVCPHCGYSSTEKNFGKLTVAQKSLILSKITSKWKGKNYSGERTFEDTIEVHKLILLNYNITHALDSEKGKLCLKFAWFYRSINDEKEHDYLKFAADFFEKSYSNEYLEEDPQNEVNILYLLGEINRRLEKFTDSIKWFQLTLQSAHIKDYPNIEKLTRDQWSEAKSQFTKSKNK
ncbi:DUF2225 domain-containing protein [Helicovermis profundi]|uniref:DUF2225 domain-containing protein n=1 Tax=Helicovermis profundi TaxID=3065157 RepID=A0AAU9E8M1_9FIRM|nr:DUF2225 domain-containing protein [Clostridia bacterium S502]